MIIFNNRVFLVVFKTKPHNRKRNQMQSALEKASVLHSTQSYASLTDMLYAIQFRMRFC